MGGTQISNVIEILARGGGVHDLVVLIVPAAVVFGEVDLVLFFNLEHSVVLRVVYGLTRNVVGKDVHYHIVLLLAVEDDEFFVCVVNVEEGIFGLGGIGIFGRYGLCVFGGRGQLGACVSVTRFGAGKDGMDHRNAETKGDGKAKKTSDFHFYSP